LNLHGFIFVEGKYFIIYDIEIIWDMQDPPWPGAEPWFAPEGWEPEPIPGGIRFVTRDQPLPTCQPREFGLILPPEFPLGDFIVILLTDKDHNVIGQIGSQRAGVATEIE
jgi:hypothetical protein